MPDADILGRLRRGWDGLPRHTQLRIVLLAAAQLCMIAFAILFPVAMGHKEARSQCKYHPVQTWTTIDGHQHNYSAPATWECMPIRAMYWTGVAGQALLVPVYLGRLKLPKHNECAGGMWLLAATTVRLFQILWWVTFAGFEIAALVYSVKPGWVWVVTNGAAALVLVSTGLLFAMLTVYSAIRAHERDVVFRRTFIAGRVVPPAGGASI